MQLDNVYTTIDIALGIYWILVYFFRVFVLEIKEDSLKIYSKNNMLNIIFILSVTILVVGEPILGYQYGKHIVALACFFCFIYFLAQKNDNTGGDFCTILFVCMFGLLFVIYAFVAKVFDDENSWSYGYWAVTFVWLACFGKILSLWKQNDVNIKDIISYVLLMPYMIFLIYFSFGVLFGLEYYPQGYGDGSFIDFIVALIGTTVYVTNTVPLLYAPTKITLACIMVYLSNIITNTLLLGAFVTMLGKYLKK